MTSTATARTLRSTLLLLILAGLILPTTIFALPAIYGEALQPVLATASDTELLEIVIFMDPAPDTREMAQYLEGVRAEDRRELLWQVMSERAELAQDDVLDALYEQEQHGVATRIRPLILTNAISAELTPAVIRAIAAMPNVREIEYSPDVYAVEPVDNPPNEIDQLTWHVEQVQADDVWNMGVTGEGIIVAVLDTGVRYTHNDLADHLWDGGAEFPNHGYDVHDNDNDPMDTYGHGTHVAGIVAGDGTSGWQTGIAPDATIMCVKISSDGASADLTDVWAGLDWALSHGADHCTLSFGWYDQPASIRQGNRDAYEALRLVGMTATKSCGNSGNSSWHNPPDEVSCPGKVPSPWRNPDQIEAGGVGGQTAVGSTNSSDNISSYSSHGPVTWEDVNPWFDYIYNNGQNQGLMKPDVSAPGENIYSLSLSDNGYTTMSGTSMASPCAAGVIALIRSANNALSPAQVDEILQTTAVDLGTPGRDNTYGAGRVNAYDAVLAAQGGGGDEYTVELTPLHDPYYIFQAGGQIEYDVVITANISTPQMGNAWIEALLPNGNTYPLDIYNVNFQPGMVITRNGMTQNVPGFAQAGEYEFIVKVGIHPGEVWAQDSFMFTKLGVATDGVTSWSSGGWGDLSDANTEIVSTQPDQFLLAPAYPNPFNPTTSLNISLPMAGELSLRVYNSLGQEVAVLANGQFNSGQHSFTFDATGMASGLYFVRAQMNDGSQQIQKMMLLR
ncbi:MAG TPA: T9SS type A sorting domain-containing protein [Bacteroidetes bacterium]|nr:bacillopeptidase F precursor [bacterium BMS3Bbin04]HDO64696.1 T9SS type A sorting domain-containing protein [Bacteroidota bacterium]HEX03821.1 T9SS type A sorting domain-containing protein [Bacteroidota bacterium]